MLVLLVGRQEANGGNRIAHASATARGRSAMAIVTIAEIIEHTTSTRRLPHRSHARKAAEINENYKRSSNTRTERDLARAIYEVLRMRYYVCGCRARAARDYCAV